MVSDAPEGVVLIREDGTRIPATSVTYSHDDDGNRVFAVAFPVTPSFPGDRIHVDRLPPCTGLVIEVEIDAGDDVVPLIGDVDAICPGCGEAVTGGNLVALGMRPEHVTPGGRVVCGRCATPAQFDDAMVLQHLTDAQLRASLDSPRYVAARQMVLDHIRRHGNGGNR